MAPRRSVSRTLLGCALVLAAPPALATTAGPPIGRVDESKQQQAAPVTPAPGAAAPHPAGLMPVLQRPEQPVETTAIPGKVTPKSPEPPPSGTMKLKYVPGYRFILSGHRENYFITGAGAATDQHTV